MCQTIPGVFPGLRRVYTEARCFEAANFRGRSEGAAIALRGLVRRKMKAPGWDPGASLRGASDVLGHAAWDACKSMMTYCWLLIGTWDAKAGSLVFSDFRRHARPSGCGKSPHGSYASRGHAHSARTSRIFTGVTSPRSPKAVAPRFSNRSAATATEAGAMP